ncbi:MAG: carbohydrate ABC transporter permease [Lachnospiraceae bacterium]|jgi:multiple sugar transport system permease protein|nr:carbohydrate ABC transporter permease [Lachnospiraceae bacterium]NBH24313.1 carbohydrate ABC transporter permease [Lachnospiraceae bacterium]
MAGKVKKAVLYIVLSLMAVTCMVPFLLMLVNATRSGREIMTSFTLIPGDSLKDNWNAVFGFFNLFRGLWNSFKVAVPATILTSYFSALTAYALAVYKFKGKNVIFYTIVIFMMIPGQLSLIGFYNLVSGLKMIDSYVPLIIPAIAAPGTVFFLKQYLESVLPMSLLEAARIDGAMEITIFHKIVFPIMVPGVATMAIGGFIGNWNSYLIPLLLLNSPKKFTLPVMIASLNASKDIGTNQGAIYMALAVSIVPILIVFCFCSKYIIGSISAGSVKE